MVDDTLANLGVLYKLLGEVGYAVLAAEDGESAPDRAAYPMSDFQENASVHPIGRPGVRDDRSAGVSMSATMPGSPQANNRRDAT